MVHDPSSPEGRLAACPDAGTLNDFAFGRLSPTTLEAIANHVGGCTICESFLGGLDQRGDPVLAAVRKSVESEDLCHVDHHRVVILVSRLLENANAVAASEDCRPTQPTTG
jgi:hypothetical protein